MPMQREVVHWATFFTFSQKFKSHNFRHFSAMKYKRHTATSTALPLSPVSLLFSSLSFFVAMKSTSKYIENQIIQRLNAGDSHRKIAQIVGVGRSTVQRVANRVFPGRTVRKNGRPSKLTERDKLYCVRQMTLGRKETAVEVDRCLEQELG